MSTVDVTPKQRIDEKAALDVIHIDGTPFLKISQADALDPFFMSVVSNSDHWMFIASNWGRTAGRKNAQYALCPYYTDDKLMDLADITGSKSIFQIETTDGLQIWEPFSDRFFGKYDLSVNLYKSAYGNQIIFEEVNHDLEFSFQYRWSSSDDFGFVKTSRLKNWGDANRSVGLLDGIQNIMPYGVSSDLQQASSNLVDAYKRSELHAESGLGIFALSAIIVDKAEPSEALKTNVAWSLGFEHPTILLSSGQLDHYRAGGQVQAERDIKGEKGAYFVSAELTLKAGDYKEWYILADVNKNHTQVIELAERIKRETDIVAKITQDISRGTKELVRLVTSSDGIQHTDDTLQDCRHFSNTLFNIMRGGVADRGYRVEKSDFEPYLKKANPTLAERQKKFLKDLPSSLTYMDLVEKARATEDPDFIRLSVEYLPLKFSRRHGDPSRPWNEFSINIRDEKDGSKVLDYEGNWRDLFQNWEALAYSYPEFLDGMIYKFLNASTFDGYNPYRITKDGFDWETIEPDDPWSYIGYWGDHQIIYLLKFLELVDKFNPGHLQDLFEREEFVYAAVPYEIKTYDEIVANPKDTIEFNPEQDNHIRKRREAEGGDGALLRNSFGEINKVNFLEKLLATLISKLSNFVPQGGIWMNTQRPEWNDANNALVGNGVSMVTLYYLRRFLKFLEPFLSESDLDRVEVSEELAEFFDGIYNALESHKGKLTGGINDSIRKTITDSLGKAGSNYRDQIYENGFSGKKSSVNVSQINQFVSLTQKYLEHSIKTNKRNDNLYHAYNLISIDDEGISISYLDEMLEGQVAVLSSNYLSGVESLEVLDALRQSALYRKDQQSYILYPNKQLPGFLEKNNIPEDLVEKSELLKKLVSDYNHRIINEDIEGGYHFNGNFKNAGDLKAALNDMKSTRYGPLVEKEEDLVLEIFEEVFNHKAFTGRSGTFFAHEGLGSIYWHMVSKLHLAVLETCVNAAKQDVDPDIMKRLATHFDEVGKGIGVHKDPEVYGAFPTDPYSHTPKHRGAQQPGMTGQVKEDILVRFGELGMYMQKGNLNFKPFLLKQNQFTDEQSSFELVSLDHSSYSINVPENALAFTCCQVPVIYEQSGKSGLSVTFKDGSSKSFDEPKLDKETSAHIFQRTGEIKEVTVSIHKKELR